MTLYQCQISEQPTPSFLSLALLVEAKKGKGERETGIKVVEQGSNIH